MKKITIYTDGSSRGNPGRGGWGAILDFQGRRKELSGGYRLTTNNRMELLAVIEALQILKESCEIKIVSDSKYVVDAVEKGWLSKWLQTGFKGKKNEDLWRRYWQVQRTHKVRFQWIKGHNLHPENERCDELATAAADGGALMEDTGYVAS